MIVKDTTKETPDRPYGCEKCGGDYAEHVRLLGGVCTRLCPWCETEWAAHLREQMCYRDIQEINAYANWAVRHGTRQDVKYAVEDIMATEQVLFRVALDWLERETPGTDDADR